MKNILISFFVLMSSNAFANETIKLIVSNGISICDSSGDTGKVCSNKVGNDTSASIDLAPEGNNLVGTQTFTIKEGYYQFDNTLTVYHLAGKEGPYLIIVSISSTKTFDNKTVIKTRPAGSVWVKDVSQLNGITWETSIEDGETSYFPRISISPSP